MEAVAVAAPLPASLTAVTVIWTVVPEGKPVGVYWLSVVVEFTGSLPEICLKTR